MSTKVEVLIVELVNDPPIDRPLYGGYWWRVRRADTSETKHGFARSEEKAKKKAEKAARTIVPEPTQNYTLEI